MQYDIRLHSGLADDLWIFAVALEVYRNLPGLSAIEEGGTSSGNGNTESCLEKHHQFSSQNQTLQVTCGILSFIWVREMDSHIGDRTANSAI